MVFYQPFKVPRQLQLLWKTELHVLVQLPPYCATLVQPFPSLHLWLQKEGFLVSKFWFSAGA